MRLFWVIFQHCAYSTKETPTLRRKVYVTQFTFFFGTKAKKKGFRKCVSDIEKYGIFPYIYFKKLQLQNTRDKSCKSQQTTVFY